MEDPVANAILNQYFRRLEQALSLLPAERREQIVEDLRAHIEDALRSEPDRSEAAVLAVLDRVGDPDEIAQEALADATDGDAVATPAGRRAGLGTASGNSAPRKAAIRLRLLVPVALALAAVVVAIPTLTGGSSAAPNRTTRDSGSVPPTSSSGWLPSGDVSGGGGVDSFRCSPQTMTGSESTATLEADATQVGSGSTDGHSWSLWSKNGVKGGPGLEEGGVIIDGVAHGLCAGFPNPAEMELLDPSGGGDAIAYGVVGYPGAAKVDIYTSTAGTFDADKLVGSTTSQVANGVGFFITTLSQSGCDLSALELNTASASYATEHNLGFATNHCAAGQLVPISDSQGIWELPPKDFPNHYGSGGGGRLLAGGAPITKNGWLPSGDVSGGGGVDSFRCSPQTMTGSESTATLEADATQVGSGSTDGHSWSLWSKNGVKGGPGLEEGGVIIDGVAHGLCAGFPNPAEMELLDPSGGGDAIAYGVVGYPGAAKVDIYTSTAGTFDADKLVGSTTSQVANGVGFFITTLSQSGCDLSALELNTASASYATEHNLGFATNHCSAGQLVPISDSQGIWELPPKDFPNHYGSRGGGGGGSAGEDIDPLGAAPTEAQLLANFAVLRRPQNALDRSWQPNCDCGHAARQLGNLTRFVGSTGHGSYRIYFDVEQFIWPGQDNLPAGSFELNVDAVERDGNVSSSSFGPNTQFTVWPFSPYPNLWVSVVPDGVASVTWTFTCSRLQARARFGMCSKAGAQTVQAPVINNLAARQVTVLGGCRRMVGPPRFPHCPGARATTVLWRAADGRLVATFPGFGNLPAPPFVKGGRGSQPLRTLQPTGVGGARISQSWRSAENLIAQTLGPAADRDVPVRDCGSQHETVWTSPAVADPLTVFERNGRFAGYTYGAPVNQIGLVQGPGAVLETARGLTIGQTIAQASRLYGRLPTTARHGVGTWSTTGPGFPLSGLVLPTIYPLRRVTGSNPIATIDAGNIGCTNAP